MTEDCYAGVHEFDSYQSDVLLDCDVVVVGSGPTGALTAYNLAAAGLDTVLLEAGPVWRPRNFILDGGETLAAGAWEGGVRAMRGRSILPTIQGRMLGGSSVINSAMCVRMPDFCLEDWQNNFGIQSLDRATLDMHYDRIEKFLGICRTEDPRALGRRNLLFKEGCDALGWSSEAPPRNVVGCDGCAECFTGCPTRAKRSMDITYVPAAIKKGLRVYTSVQIDRVLHEAGSATGVVGRIVHPHPSRQEPYFGFRCFAKAVVMASGCLATPVILQKSAIDVPDKLIGANLQAHPGAAIHAVFEEDVNPWHGATQGYQSLQFIEQGYKMEVLWAPPPVLAVRFPGFGQAFKRNLATFKHGAIWDAIFSLKHTRGRVKAKRNGNPDVIYSVDQRDMPVIVDGMARLMEIGFAAGAKSLLPGIYGLPHIVYDRNSIADLRKRNCKPGDFILASTHLFCSTRMGPDPKTAVVDETGELYHLRNCYIADTGVMPRSPAVNPMLTAMALADMFSGAIIDRYR